VPLAEDAAGLLVKPEVAMKQLNAEKAPETAKDKKEGEKDPEDKNKEGQDPDPPQPSAAQPKRFHGTVALNPTRVGRDAGQIAEELICHLTGLVGSDVKITLEIEATMPSGAPENVVRTVTENSVALKFISHGFEKE
jgi:hypothetical protein